jgi:hypothetical protein
MEIKIIPVMEIEMINTVKSLTTKTHQDIMES